MGAWIETVALLVRSMPLTVAPYVGAWIETECTTESLVSVKSHPTWVRGLKHLLKAWLYCETIVAPYVGAWIET